MKKANFDMLKNLPVPEGWVDKALLIPENEEKKKAAVPWWRNRAMVAAASLVLVSALSLLVYLGFGNKPPVEVKPSVPATEIVWSTDENGETVATEIVIVNDTVPIQDGTLPTEPKSPFERFIANIFGTELPLPTNAGDQGSRTNPTSKTTPTEKSGSAGNGNYDPTAKTDPPEPPVQPTQKPYQSPTEAQWDPPSEPSWEPPTAAPWVPGWETPTTAPWEASTDAPPPYQPPSKSQRRRLLYTSIPKESVPTDTIVYCMFYTNNGTALGGFGAYASQRRMTLSSYGNKYTYYYVISDYLTIPDELEGTTAAFEVYDSAGNILTTGSYRL